MTVDLAGITSQFQIPGAYVGGGPYGSGHINDTYAIRVTDGSRVTRYILQRVNHLIFKDVPAVMDNIERVTSHIRLGLETEGAGDIDRRTLAVIPTRTGQSYHQDDDGSFWRAYIFIERAQTYDIIERPDQAYQAARAFGIFQKQLRDLPEPRLNETIPNFHNTPARFAALVEAIEADVANRAADVKEEIGFALAREAMCGVLIGEMEAGHIPERITHNDTKLNNVMLDDATGDGICVIDLDTVMPGLVLYDFGDQVRSSVSAGAEDTQDLSEVSARPEYFEALARGYLEAIGDSLTQAEKDHLAFSGRLITFEIGIRFLTDYLQGDVYFKTHRPRQNVDRTKRHFVLVKDLEKREQEFSKVVVRYS